MSEKKRAEYVYHAEFEEFWNGHPYWGTAKACAYEAWLAGPGPGHSVAGKPAKEVPPHPRLERAVQKLRYRGLLTETIHADYAGFFTTELPPVIASLDKNLHYTELVAAAKDVAFRMCYLSTVGDDREKQECLKAVLSKIEGD